MDVILPAVLCMITAEVTSAKKMNCVRRFRALAMALRAFCAKPASEEKQEKRKNDWKKRASVRRSRVSVRRRSTIRGIVSPKVLLSADELFKEYKVTELYEFLLEYKEIDHEEILWRLARAAHEYAQQQDDSEKRKKLMLEAFSYAERALDMNTLNSHCHTWYAALLHFTTEDLGFKDKIASAYEIRDHFDKALEIDPTDVIALHSIGYWCYALAELPWYQKKAASTIFMTMPDATFDEALEWFLKAEEMPDVMLTNSVMIAKVYLRRKDKKKAIIYLKKALSMKFFNPTDKAAEKDAREMLKSLGVKV